MSTERKRSAIATTVFSFSLLVFSALLAFLFLNRVSEGAAKLRARIGDNPEKVTGLRLGKIEFISAGAARGGLSIGLALGHRFIQIAIAYGWLIFALSLFDATRGYTERLTGMVVKPLYGLAARIGGALPLIVVAAIAVLAVSVLVRFVGLFFDSIGRGDTRVAVAGARPRAADQRARALRHRRDRARAGVAAHHRRDRRRDLARRPHRARRRGARRDAAARVRASSASPWSSVGA